RVEEELSGLLISELVGLEAHFAKLRGQPTDPERWLARFPEHADAIHRALGGPPANATARVQIASLERDASLGPYTIVREIGRGGMGVVYEARHANLDRRVALKLLTSKASNDPQAEARFEREARAIGRLHHSSIVPVFDSGTVDGVRFFAMQLIEGRSLAELIRKRREEEHNALAPESLDRLLQQILGVARAIHFAHGQGVIHRDVKPSNILIDSSGAPWLVDFGVARVEESDLTTPEDILGTIRYMPPERFGGVSGATDDVYALGVTLFEALVLHPVFVETDPAALMHRIVQGRPPRLREILPSASKDLEVVVSMAMQANGNRGYASALAFAEDLQRLLDDIPVTARRPGLLERAWRWSRRNRSAAAALLLLGILTLTGTVLSVALERRSGRILELSENVSNLLTESEARGNSLRSELYRSNLQRVAHGIFKDQGQQFLDLLNECGGSDGDREGTVDHRGWEWHVLRSAVASEESLVQYPTRSGGAIAWSQARGWLAIGGAGGIRLVDLTTRKTLREIGGFSYLRSLAFDESGSRLLASAADGIRVIDTDEGSILAFRPSREFKAAQWIEGGKLALVQVPDPMMWSIEDDVLTPHPATSFRSRATAVSADGAMLARLTDPTTITVMRARTGETLQAIDLTPFAPLVPHNYIEFSPDGTRLAMSANKSELHVFDLDDGSHVFGATVGEALDVTALAWSADGTTLATTTNRSGVKVWDAQTGDVLRTLRGHLGNVRDAVFVDDDRQLVTTSEHYDVRFWDLEEPPGHLHIDGRAGSGTHRIVRLIWDADGSQVSLLGSRGRAVWRVDGATPEFAGLSEYRHDFPGPDDSLELVLDPKRLRLVDTRTGDDLFAGLEGEPFESPTARGKRAHYEWSADGRQIYVGEPGRGWIVENLRIGARARRLMEQGFMRSLDLDPTGQLMLLAGDAPFPVVDTATGDEVARLDPPEPPPNRLPSVPAFSPTGSLLALGWGRRVYIYDANTFELRRVIRTFSETLGYLRWSPDETRIAGATHGGTVCIFGPNEGLLVTFDCPTAISDLAWSPGSERLAAVDLEGFWHIWDARASLQGKR
ncbi:MAG: serine/threonine-protein kinase, partial [Planctomycetota bacterium]